MLITDHRSPITVRGGLQHPGVVGGGISHDFLLS